DVLPDQSFIEELGDHGSELDHASDAVLRVHQLEPAVDLVERDPVRDERIDVDVAVEVALDELRDLVAALDAAEARAAHAPALDQGAGDDAGRLPLAGAARARAQAPAHARGLDRLLHHMHEAGRLEGVVGAEAAGLVEDALDDVLARHPGVGRALAL